MSSALVLISCNTSVPINDSVGFHPESSCDRGTASIIWSCLTVMIFAFWSTFHLNTRTLPSKLWYKSRVQSTTLFVRNTRATITGKQKTTYQSDVKAPCFTTRKILEVIFTILFPDTGVVVAAEEYIVAFYIRKHTRQIPGWKDFGITQAHLVAMGGIILPGLDIKEDFDQYVILNELQFDAFPSRAEISRRTKKEYFDKIIACWQGIYFIANCALRYTHRYSIARLEFTALNYLTYAFVVSILRFRKPQELQDPFILKGLSRSDTEDEYILSTLSGLVEERGSPDSNFYTWYRSKRYFICIFIMVILAVTGSLNFLLRFPGITRHTQSFLWRMALAGMVCIGLIPFPVVLQLSVYKSPLVHRFWAGYVSTLCVMYAALRLYWLVDSFYHFRYATAAVYAKTSS